MEENDQEAIRRGWVYYWANEEKTLKVMDIHPDQVRFGKRVPVECYSRIVGYMRPIKSWNPAKQEEFKDRQVYDVPVLRSPMTYDGPPLVVKVTVEEEES